jgi:hypothetical protein
MAGATANAVDGTTIVFGTTSWTADLQSIGLDGVERDAIDTSHINTAAAGANAFGNAPYIPSGIVDGGALSIGCSYDPDTLPPIGAVEETITITFPKQPDDASAASISFTGFVTGFSFTGEKKGYFTASLTVKVSGSITITAAVAT